MYSLFNIFFRDSVSQLGILFISQVAPYFPDPLSQDNWFQPGFHSHLRNKTGIMCISSSSFFFLSRKSQNPEVKRDLIWSDLILIWSVNRLLKEERKKPRISRGHKALTEKGRLRVKETELQDKTWVSNINDHKQATQLG